MTQGPPVLRKTSMVVVVDYDPAWPDRFEQLRTRIWPVVADVALGIEHVGSTAVPGLAAKPIIDMTVVVPSRPDVIVTIDRLATLGYRHRGSLGIEDREAFDHDEGLPAHNLYVCPQETIGVINQLVRIRYRNYWRPAAAARGSFRKVRMRSSSASSSRLKARSRGGREST